MVVMVKNNVVMVPNHDKKTSIRRMKRERQKTESDGII
jgi:hypothetical protein